MRKTLLAAIVLLIMLTPIIAGCATNAPPATTPPATTAPTVVQGELSGVITQPPQVTVQTPQGPKEFPILPSTALTIQGQTCTLDDLNALDASGQPYNCTVVLDANDNVVAVNVVKYPTPTVTAAAVTGSISDVNITSSTVTVLTGDGPKVFNVDQTTGLLIGGVACSLGLIDSLQQEVGNISDCTVIYDNTNPNQAVYIDIANPPSSITQGTGTLTAVNPAKSTVTIETDKGPRTFEVDATTGTFLNGEVCNLDALLAAQKEEGSSPNSCQVAYYTDKDGNLVYIDITSGVPPPQ